MIGDIDGSTIAAHRTGRVAPTHALLIGLLVRGLGSGRCRVLGQEQRAALAICRLGRRHVARWHGHESGNFMKPVTELRREDVRAIGAAVRTLASAADIILRAAKVTRELAVEIDDVVFVVGRGTEARNERSERGILSVHRLVACLHEPSRSGVHRSFSGSTSGDSSS